MSVGSGAGSASPTRLGADLRPYVGGPDEVIEELAPMQRDRCNTWPMRRPNLESNSSNSPLMHEQIPEEVDLYDSSEQIGRLGASSAASNGLLHSPDGNNTFSPGYSSGNIASPIMNGVPPSGASDTSDSGSKKSTTRRNAWGNMSYADLITQAIMNSPEKRLTLSQVYEWMVQNVPYFRDKGDSNSSAGWKVSLLTVPQGRSEMLSGIHSSVTMLCLCLCVDFFCFAPGSYRLCEHLRTMQTKAVASRDNRGTGRDSFHSIYDMTISKVSIVALCPGGTLLVASLSPCRQSVAIEVKGKPP